MHSSPEKELYEPLGFFRVLAGSIAISAAVLFPAEGAAQEPVKRQAQQDRGEGFLRVVNSKTFGQQFAAENEYFFVEIAGRNYRAYQLHNKKQEISENYMPWDLSVIRPWLITDQQGNTVLDPETVHRAALTAKYTENRKELSESVYTRAQMYSSILSQTASKELALDVARNVSKDLYSQLLGGVLGKAGAPIVLEQVPSLKGPLMELTKEVALDILGTKLKKVMVGKDLKNIDSSQVFKEAMYDTIKESVQEMKSLQRELRKKPRSFAKAKDMSDRLIRAETQARAAIAGLINYYGSDMSQGAWNFFLEQVVQPAAEGTTGLPIEGFLNIHGPALEEYFREVAVSSKRFENIYGMESIEKGEELVLNTLRKTAIQRAEQEFKSRLGEIGFKDFYPLYKSLRKAAFRGGIEEKINYVFFLTDLLSATYPIEIPRDQWEEAARVQRKLAPLPPKKFIREYDRLARRALLNPGKNKYAIAALSAANLILPYVQHSEYVPQNPVTQKSGGRARQPFDRSAFHRMYLEGIAQAEKYISFLEGQDISPERRGRVQNKRRDLEKLKRYYKVFHGGSITPTQKQALQFMFRQYATDLERSLRR
ncbi:MAG: hypothetical protein ISS93_02190 [Candidatus Aenigmarchaeota archaeon]|nr:hypothetical protein [Candidatus Aenigmarchaeota archaeon]